MAVYEIEHGVIHSDGESKALAGGLMFASALAFLYTGSHFNDAVRLSKEGERLEKVAKKNRK